MRLKVDLWDVGQGDCSVVHLPDDQLFIIDVGPPDSMLPSWLDARPKLGIHSLVLTHNDADHAGCAMDILQRFHSRLKNFIFVDDRSFGESRATSQLLAFGARLHRERRINMIRMEAGADPQPLWGFDGGLSSRSIIYALYPDVAATVANLHGRKDAKPNEVSGILCLDVNGKTEVIWAGDASMQTVARVCSNRQPIVIVGPHHGGPIKRNQASFAPSFEDPSPNNVFVSVGTSNQHNHPVKNFIDQHRKRKRKVCCSQLVHCDRRRVKAGKHLMNNHLSLAMLPPKSARAVTCRGPMQLSWSAEEKAFEFDRFHQLHMESLAQVGNPYCRPCD